MASRSTTAGAAPATGLQPPKPTLSEGHSLVNAVDFPGGTGGGGGGAKPIAVLEGPALATAAASAELVALRAAVAAKDVAVALGWKRRWGTATSPGWGVAFPAPPATTWKEAAAAAAAAESASDGGQQQQRRQQLIVDWEVWQKSVSGLVDTMNGVLVGLAAASPSLRSSLEDHLETRWEQGDGRERKNETLA